MKVSTPLFCCKIWKKRGFKAKKTIILDAEFGRSDLKCLIKWENRSLIVNCHWRRLGAISAVLVTGLGQRPTNRTELWNLGHSSPQACWSVFLLFGFLHSTFKNKVRWKSCDWDFRREQRKYLESRQLPEQLLKHELSSTYTLIKLLREFVLSKALTQHMWWNLGPQTLTHLCSEFEVKLLISANHLN